MIHIYYGYGKGKTCSAVGAGMRAYGAGNSVSLVRFFKDSKSSELLSVPFDIFKAPNSLPFNPDDSYITWVNDALEYVKSTNAKVVILDEFLDLVPRFLSVNDAKSLLANDKEYIITGHDLVDELAEIADYITLFDKKKHPYDKGIKARKGIEF